MLKNTPLNSVHKELKAKMVDFNGWEMPIQYSGLIKEHEAVRNAAGLFDVSHMGEIEIKGPKAYDFLQYLITNDLKKLGDGKILYTVMCYVDGGVVDDLLVYRIAENSYMLCINASNVDKDYQWILEHQIDNVEIRNVSTKTAQLAIQGPDSEKILQQIVNIDLNNLKYYHFKTGKVSHFKALIARTGYTGEDGFEIFLEPKDAEYLFRMILEIGEKHAILPAGLGARDTLRLEMGYSLYGHEIDQNHNPLEAKLEWLVKFDKGNFIGKQTLTKLKEEGLKRQLAGFELQERGIPRAGYKVLKNNDETGEVVSGTYSPSLKKGIGTAYVASEHANIGEEIEIEIRGKKVIGKLVNTPFYKDAGNKAKKKK